MVSIFITKMDSHVAENFTQKTYAVHKKLLKEKLIKVNLYNRFNYDVKFVLL